MRPTTYECTQLQCAQQNLLESGRCRKFSTRNLPSAVLRVSTDRLMEFGNVWKCLESLEWPNSKASFTMSFFFLGFELSVRRLYSVCLDLRGLLSDPLGVVSMPIKFNPHDHCKVPKIVRGCGTRSLSEMRSC